MRYSNLESRERRGTVRTDTKNRLSEVLKNTKSANAATNGKNGTNFVPNSLNAHSGSKFKYYVEPPNCVSKDPELLAFWDQQFEDQEVAMHWRRSDEQLLVLLVSNTRYAYQCVASGGVASDTVTRVIQSCVNALGKSPIGRTALKVKPVVDNTDERLTALRPSGEKREGLTFDVAKAVSGQIVN